MRITIVGLGHLGSVAAGALAAAGHEVTGLDLNAKRVREMQTATLDIFEPGLQELIASGVDRGNLRLYGLDEFSDPLGEVALIATGTPSGPGGEADLTQVRSALAWIKSRAVPGLTVVMKSTVPPGSGLDFIHHDLEGSNVCYVSNPEFLREGKALQDWFFPDRIVLGVEPESSRGITAARQMYSDIESPSLETDITSAEMIKYANNAFLATRISFINEIASLCQAVGASVDEVSNGLALDKRLGRKVHAGVGYGGSCFPKDIEALEYLAWEAGIDLDLLPAVTAVNKRQRKLPIQSLFSKFGWDLSGIQVGVLGLAFKPLTNDVRCAVSLDVVSSLLDLGASVRAYDPQARKFAQELLPTCVEFAGRPEEAAIGAQALVLLTEWQEICQADWEAIADNMRPPKFIFDGRNALDASRMVNLGFDYVGVGLGNLPLPSLTAADSNVATEAPPVSRRVARSMSTKQTEKVLYHHG